MKIIEHENLRGHMGCIRYKSMVLGECCPICVNYTIKHYSTMFSSINLVDCQKLFNL